MLSNNSDFLHYQILVPILAKFFINHSKNSYDGTKLHTIFIVYLKEEKDPYHIPKGIRCQMLLMEARIFQKPWKGYFQQEKSAILGQIWLNWLIFLEISWIFTILTAFCDTLSVKLHISAKYKDFWCKKWSKIDKIWKKC